jgi:tetratricopeptide (TPR) repeat protein
MKKIVFLILLISAAIKVQAAQQQVSPDTLKKELQVTADSCKAPVYTLLADVYLKYDTIANRRKRTLYQTEALNYTMQALHYYSRYNDSAGLRVSFDNLAKVYFSQRKFSQAKWFILQSNSISRIKNDTLNVITSLVKLSMVKMEIKDFSLAMRDLNEALSLSIAGHMPQWEATVQKNYGFLYNRMDKPEKGAIALKRAEVILDSLKRDEAAKMLAIQRFARDTIGTRTIDSALKKKVVITAAKKPVKAKKAPLKKAVASL